MLRETYLAAGCAQVSVTGKWVGASIFVPRSRNYYADIHYALLLEGIHRGCGLHLAYTSVPAHIDVYVTHYPSPIYLGSGLRVLCVIRGVRGFCVITTDHRRGGKSWPFDFYARPTIRPFILMRRSLRHGLSIFSLDRRYRHPSRSIFNFFPFSRITGSSFDFQILDRSIIRFCLAGTG